MSEYIEVIAWICVIGIVFAIITIPFKATSSNKFKYRTYQKDETIEFVVGKATLINKIDKRRWDNVTLFRK